ncbi:MAG: MBL fold metallo-hydrolase [Candidatus Riflebacteria bacterium]|jgi:competence protein ComEC|nr:MBL fold metallo-hydrolase [Candidatus Riflebacteria bacterium]
MNHCFARIGILLTLAVLLVSTAYANEAPLLRVTFLDVHQGDCILIRSAEKTIMIDAGDDNRSAAIRYIIPYLKKEGIKRIDQAIITHPHRDHFGGFIDLIKEFKFGEFIYSNDSEVSSEGATTKGGNDALIYGQLRTLIMENKIPYRHAKLGELLDWGEGIKAEVLYCDVNREESTPSDVLKTNPNELSVVIKATAGNISYLFTGDAEKKAETEMISLHGKKLASTVLKSGHHGSKTSSMHAFMDIVQPGYGVISAGKGNSFGHPTQAVLDIYDYYKMTVFRTDNDGTVESYTDGKTVTFVTNNSPLEFASKPKVISLTANSATIQWETNRPATTLVNYGVSSLNQSKELLHGVKVHTVTLTGLKPSTTYKYVAISKDPREPEKLISLEASITTPAGSGDPLPKISKVSANYDRIYMKHPFKIHVPVNNPAETPSKALTLEVYHSAMDASNLIDKVKFASVPAASEVEAVLPTQIDWIGPVEIIAILKQGSTIIDTFSTFVTVEPKMILVDCTHGNKDYFTGRFAGMKMDLFRSHGFQMASISKAMTYESIKDAFVIMLPHPTVDYKATEVTALKKYVSGGGSLMMFGQSDYKNLSNPDMFNSILKGIGSKIRFNDDQACDPTDNIGPPWRMFIKTFPAAEITGTDVTKLLVRSSCTFINSQNKGLKASKNLFIFASGDEDSYNTESDAMSDGYIYASHTPLLPIPLAAGEDLGFGRVACFGEPFYQDSYYASNGDKMTATFNRNVVKWLSLGKEKTVKALVRYIAELDQETDLEVRAERYEAISKTVMKKVRREVDYDRHALSEIGSMLDEHQGTPVDDLKMQIDQIYRFDSLHQGN